MKDEHLTGAEEPDRSRFRIEYDNDSGLSDEGFWEWWSVVDESTGKTLCKCDDEESAELIRTALVLLGRS